MVHDERLTQRTGLGFVEPASAIAAGSAGGPVGIAIAAAAVGIQIALQKLFSRKGPQQRIDASNLANQLEAILKQNVAEWKASYKTVEEQQKHLAAFDYAWGRFVTDLNTLGNPGKVGIQERSRGGRWDYFALYRDPIANDETKTYTEAWGTALGLGEGEQAVSNLLLFGGIALLVIGAMNID